MSSTVPVASFDKARNFVLSLKLRSAVEWRQWCSGELVDKPPRPETIPSNPHQVYHGLGWISMRHWLGVKTKAPYQRIFLPYDEAAVFVRRLGLRTWSELNRWSAGKLPHLPPRPENIPSNPSTVYREKGWKGMGHYLGIGIEQNPTISIMRSFSEARQYARELQISGQIEWYKWAVHGIEGKPERPRDIPSNPYGTYRHKGWTNWGDFLGTGSRSYRLPPRPFKEARAFVRSLGLKSQPEYRKWATSSARPRDIPSNPEKTYPRWEWKGYPNWLHANGSKPK